MRYHFIFRTNLIIVLSSTTNVRELVRMLILVGFKQRCNKKNLKYLKRKFIVTTNSNDSNSISKIQLNRVYSYFKLGKKVSGITYIKFNGNCNYLTTIIDLADLKIVG